jgi:hypothetical protein
MKFISVRELLATPAQVWKELPGEQEIVITNNGKPLKPDPPAPAPAASDGPEKAPFAVLLERIKEEVNTRLPGFSSVHRMELQSEPFERTPSQKIKRFLYPRRPGLESQGR